MPVSQCTCSALRCRKQLSLAGSPLLCPGAQAVLLPGLGCCGTSSRCGKTGVADVSATCFCVIWLPVQRAGSCLAADIITYDPACLKQAPYTLEVVSIPPVFANRVSLSLAARYLHDH